MKFLFLLCTFFCASSLTGLFAQSTARSAAELFRIIYHERKADVPFDFECTSFATCCVQGKSTSFSAFDGSGAVIFITHKSISNIFLRAGERIKVKGKTEIYDFNQVVALCDSIEHIGQDSAPLPESASAAELVSGKFDCRLVKIKGTLRDMFQDEIDSHYRYFVLNCDGKMVYASSRKIGDADMTIGALVEITGICDPIAIGGRRHMGRTIKIKSCRQIGIASTPVDNVFDSPLIDNVSSLGPMEIQSLGIRRARGTVIATWHPQKVLVKTERSNLISATIANQKLPATGMSIEIAGLPETDLFNINLSRAAWKASDCRIGVPQEPLEMDFEEFFGPHKSRKVSPYFHGSLIRIKGNVIGVESAGGHIGTILISGNERVLAIDTSTVPDAANGISAGCKIEVAGVCIL